MKRTRQTQYLKTAHINIYRQVADDKKTRERRFSRKTNCHEHMGMLGALMNILRKYARHAAAGLTAKLTQS